ncbi:multiheme c-type cytochrome [Alteromonas sp. BMJM2]|uniref:multiheme c-type cytochrome n=1 Tax=Alteromonas sp. BMJM2 TaxID=2954241 RepID=UPI0022B3BC80|nr:multiheme c-type cytochrome [Alteromonas sp. BMJM2]
MFRQLLLLILTGIVLNAFAGEPEQCGSCHQEQLSDWLKSDHSKAMDVATEATVKGNFDNLVFEHFNQKATFFKRDGKYFIKFEENEHTTDYEVSYVFGHFPLQEYLIKTDSGKMQVFPFAWDSREKSIGGQRWYPIYPDEEISQQDRLHWLQPLQNWNGMCADCHSSGLQRNYDSERDSFKTVWNEVNVSCQSCHGKLSNGHYKKSKTSHSALTKDEQKNIGNWLLGENDDIASWTGPERDNRFMDTCFACHSLRTPLTDGIDPSEPFLSQFKPALLSTPQYHVDGQIRDEVYVYGSFLQSKMFEAGVNCNDCHNPHTAKVKVEGNGLCLQCHKSSTFDDVKHHRHEPDTAGSQCVNCHMPTNTYMGVDERRDHSFHIPTPSLSEKFDTPNACNGCHEDKSAKWAKDSLIDWHGAPTSPHPTEMQYMRLLSGERLTANRHIALAKNSSLPDIKRATVISLLPNTLQTLPYNYAKVLASDSSPLVRLAFADISFLVDRNKRSQLLKPLLQDQFRAIRIASAEQLIASGEVSLVSSTVLSEMTESSQQTLWRGEGNLNASLVQANLGNFDKAEEFLKAGISRDPFFEPNHINLANLYRSLGKDHLEGSTLKDGLEANPQSSLMHYAEGMRLIRAQDIDTAIIHLTKANNIEPSNSNYLYILMLALDKAGDTKGAIEILKDKVSSVNNQFELLQLGLNFSQKLGLRIEYMHFKKELEKAQRQ